MKVVQLYEWTPKQFLNPTLNPKNSPLGPQKVEKNLSELKGIKKIKVVALYEYTTKQSVITR